MLRLAACLGVAMALPSAGAVPAHEHGVARLDPGVEATRVALAR